MATFSIQYQNAVWRLELPSPISPITVVEMGYWSGVPSHDPIICEYRITT